jgi:DNA-binding NarL/FixJ family response regulator
MCHPALASWRVEAAEALTALGESARVGRLAEEHLRLAERLGTPSPQAAGLRALARSVGGDERLELLERAVALGVTSPARLEHVRDMVELGAAMRRINRRADAQHQLRRALHLADADGMSLLARQARAELLATGARPRRPASTGPQALTPAERQVTSLAATGHSNRDIAARLYITRRTVETHLTHSFAKLGISSRAELAASFVEAPDRPRPPQS